MVHCTGADDLVRGHEAVFLTQLDGIEPVDPRNTMLVPDDSPRYQLAKLFLEAQLRQMPATGVAPDLEGMGVFEPMEFQRETVAHALLQLRPRLLIADAVGLGKTIQVGMIISELMRRGKANRILVLAKKSMLTQFQAELWNRFNIPLLRLDSVGIARLRLKIPANKNPFEIYHRVIISMDTLKNVAKYEHFLRETRWDVVVIDEAHNVAGASIPEQNLSHRLARQLARRSDSLLLTTATPHNGKRETFGRLISLLDPSAIPDPNLREYEAEDVRNFFLMRYKEDVREDAGDLLHTQSVVPLAATTADATQNEEQIYRLLAQLRQAVKDARQSMEPGKQRWHHQALIQYGIYKLFLSSPEACRITAEERVAKLIEADIKTPEIDYLEKILGVLCELKIEDTARYGLLLKQLSDIGWRGKANDPRILIFTESPRTQRVLAAALAKTFGIKFSDRYDDQPSQVIATIGGDTPDVHLMKTVESFATGNAKIRMLIATDVASEGINLHHECHLLIHYDLPWSIITLVQRNGRIDRLGQTETPIIRYLVVNTAEGLLQGDREIFERLIGKVEEINRLRQSGESVLQLYDPEAEEAYVARKGLIEGDASVVDEAACAVESEAALLERMLREAVEQPDEDFMRFLTGDKAVTGPADESTNAVSERLRLYSDRAFLVDGYAYLSDLSPEYPRLNAAGHLLTLTAPKDLQRRLGGSGRSGDVVFGATAIPQEAWPEHDEFRLTESPEKVQLAIEAARNMSGYWSREMLCTESHPILQWVTERLVMQIPRGEAPIVPSQKLPVGELVFCFIGQVSSKAGTPLVVDAHAICFTGDGKIERRPLAKTLRDADILNLVNTGHPPANEAAQPLVPAAVESSLDYLRECRTTHEKLGVPLLRREERRLREWRNRRRMLLETRIKEWGENDRRSKQAKRMLDEMDEYLNDRRQNWRDTHFLAANEPSTQLVLVVVGVGQDGQ